MPPDLERDFDARDVQVVVLTGTGHAPRLESEIGLVRAALAP
jgi:hypothetical protein